MYAGEVASPWQGSFRSCLAAMDKRTRNVWDRGPGDVNLCPSVVAEDRLDRHGETFRVRAGVGVQIGQFPPVHIGRRSDVGEAAGGQSVLVVEQLSRGGRCGVDVGGRSERKGLLWCERRTRSVDPVDGHPPEGLRRIRRVKLREDTVSKAPPTMSAAYSRLPSLTATALTFCAAAYRPAWSSAISTDLRFHESAPGRLISRTSRFTPMSVRTMSARPTWRTTSSSDQSSTSVNRSWTISSATFSTGAPKSPRCSCWRRRSAKSGQRAVMRSMHRRYDARCVTDWSLFELTVPESTYSALQESASSEMIGGSGRAAEGRSTRGRRLLVLKHRPRPAVASWRRVSIRPCRRVSAKSSWHVLSGASKRMRRAPR